MNLKKNETADFHRLSQIEQNQSVFIRKNLWFQKLILPECLRIEENSLL
jgi:hypothetical protein